MDFSIIIPQRNSLKTLPRLLDSIPINDNIEIIVVDNSPSPIKKSDICTDRDFTLLWSAPERYAGGARNVGVENAHGKWLIFADADDYFTKDAFTSFFKNVDSEHDIIFFCARGVYDDIGEPSERGKVYCELVNNYLNNDKEENDLRYKFCVPWAKMVKKEMVDNNKIRFDEVIASNDIFFSVMCGYNASTIAADSTSVYIVTVSKGSLTQKRDITAIESRYRVYLRLNQFYRTNNLREQQLSVMYFIVQSLKAGPLIFFKFLRLLVSYHQNPFYGYKSWIGTYFKNRNNDKKESNYRTK